ncbi:MAG: hypothetical protein ABIE36_00680 [Candidatus Diapherotrites archaeon]
MEMSQIYVIIAIVVLAIIALLVFFSSKNKKKNKFTPLTGLAFGFIIAGIAFVDNRWLGYSFFGAAIVLAVIDMVLKMKKISRQKR